LMTLEQTPSTVRLERTTGMVYCCAIAQALLNIVFTRSASGRCYSSANETS